MDSNQVYLSYVCIKNMTGMEKQSNSIKQNIGHEQELADDFDSKNNHIFVK